MSRIDEMKLLRSELYGKLRNAVFEGLKKVNEAIIENAGKSWFWDTNYERPELSSFENGLPYINKTSAKNYTPFFYKDEIINQLPSFRDYKDFILKTDYLCNHFQIGDYLEEGLKSLPDTIDIWNNMPSKYHLASFINSYIHTYSLQFTEENFDLLANNYLNSIFFFSLPIDIYIPIIFTKFDFDNFVIMDGIIIERISDELQLSRNRTNSHNYIAHPIVYGAATHAFVLKNWSIKNSPIPVRSSNPLNSINSYSGALEIAKQLFAALRIALPEIETGFCQIFAVPCNWQSSFDYELTQTFKVYEKNYPLYFEDYGWLSQPPTVSKGDSENIKKAYTSISTSSYLDLAWKRLNKACLNNRDDDSIIDICIALEALLTGDTKTEITYRLAVRASLLNKIVPFRNYTSEDIFTLCKKLYDFRSAIVHGDKKRFEKNRVIKILVSEEVPAVSIGIDYLKHIIWALIDNPQYNSSSKFDQLLYLENSTPLNESSAFNT